VPVEKKKSGAPIPSSILERKVVDKEKKKGEEIEITRPFSSHFVHPPGREKKVGKQPSPREEKKQRRGKKKISSTRYPAHIYFMYREKKKRAGAA